MRWKRQKRLPESVLAALRPNAADLLRQQAG
jgi:hypothetical protein